MAYVKADAWVLQQIATTGLPLVGGSVSAYITGTTTPLAMYTDSAGNGSATSFTLNSLGMPQSAGGTAIDIYLDDAYVYKFIIRDSSGVAVGPTIDPVYPGGGNGLTGTMTSMEALRASSVSVDYIETVAFYEDGTTGAAKLYRDGTGTPTGSGAANISAALSDDVFCNAAGHIYKLMPTQRISLMMFGAKGDYNGSTGTDDTQFIQNAIDYCVNSYDTTTKAIPLFAEVGNYRATARIDIPPAVTIFGSGIYNGTSNTLGTLFWKTHDGVLFRFIRNASGTTLYHNGGMRFCWMTGNGSSDTTASRLIEFGDPANVDANNGAWNVTIEDCAIQNSYGYGIYSAHSQECIINRVFFRELRHAVWYNTVTASARVTNCTFISNNAGINSYAVVLLRGSRGGAAGATVADNYFISPKVGIWMSNQIGAIVRGNTIEGAKDEAIMMGRVLPSGTADVSESGMQNGCKGCHIEQNNFINWNADSGAKHCIQINYSRNNYIGHQGYFSPNASSPGALGFLTDGTDPCKDNIIVQPIVMGNNASTVPGWVVAETIMQAQFMIRQDGIKLAENAYTGTRGASDKGQIFMDANANVLLWDGAATKRGVFVESTLAGSAGAQTAWLRYNHNGTNYKLPLYADA